MTKGGRTVVPSELLLTVLLLVAEIRYFRNSEAQNRPAHPGFHAQPGCSRPTWLVHLVAETTFRRRCHAEKTGQAPRLLHRR